MHAPPYHKKRTWQRFLAGAVIGAILSYWIFIYMYGTMYEQLLEQKLELESRVTDLENQNAALLEDNENLDERTAEAATVEAVEITITNGEELSLDRLIVHQLEEMLKEELSHLIGEDLSLISGSDRLLVSTIQNKGFSIDQFTYYFTVTKLIMSQTIRLEVEAKQSS